MERIMTGIAGQDGAMAPRVLARVAPGGSARQRCGIAGGARTCKFPLPASREGRYQEGTEGGPAPAAEGAGSS